MKNAYWTPGPFDCAKNIRDAAYPHLLPNIGYSAVLQPRFITQLIDIVGKNHGTFTGMPASYWNSIYGYYEFFFYDTYGYTNCGSIANFTSEDFTISMWYRRWLTPTGTCIAFWKGSYQVDGYYYAINTDNSGAFVTNQSGAAQVTTSIVNMHNNTDIMLISFIRKGSSIRINKNGIDVTNSVGTHIDPTSASANNFQIGKYSGGGFEQNHAFSDFMIYNRALSHGQLKELYYLGPGGWAQPKKQRRISIQASTSRIKNIFMGGIITGNTKKVFTDYNIMTGVQ